LAGLLVTVACRQPPPSRAQAEVFQSPPGPKDAIAAAIAHHDLLLSTYPSCSGVGTEPADSTIGQYLAGFLGHQTDDAGKNWIEAGCTASTSPGAAWQCRVVIRRRNPAQEEEWGWGVRFLIRANRSVIRESFECTGSG
jgi:hypothetical protein